MEIDLDCFDAHWLRKAALPINGTEEDEVSVIRSCLRHREHNPGQVYDLQHELSDELVAGVVSHLVINLESCDHETILNFAIKNSSPIYSKSIVQQLGELRFFTREDDLAILNATKQGCDSFDVFDEMFPGSRGVVTFSRVGFNQAVDEAIICYGNRGGMYMLMRKKNNKWEIDERIVAWWN